MVGFHITGPFVEGMTVTGKSLHKGPVMWNLEDDYAVSLNKLLNK